MHKMFLDLTCILEKAKPDGGLENEKGDDKLNDETGKNRTPSHLGRIVRKDEEEEEEDEESQTGNEGVGMTEDVADDEHDAHESRQNEDREDDVEKNVAPTATRDGLMEELSRLKGKRNIETVQGEPIRQLRPTICIHIFFL